MTTTITVETHSWPVEVVSTSEHYHNSDYARSEGFQSTTTFVPKDTNQQFTVSSGTTLRIRELPADAEGLGPDPRITINEACCASNSVG